MMRRFFKKAISLTLATVLTFSLVPVAEFTGTVTDVSAAETLKSDSKQIKDDIVPDTQLRYALSFIIGGDKYANITVGDLKNYEGEIDLSQYEDYEKIENLEGLGYARSASSIDASKLTKVKQIKEHEFQDCGFVTFGMPQNIEIIGKAAFFNCKNLTYVNLPDSLTIIQSEAFRNCKSLDGITFPENIRKIGDNAFAVCESLTSIKIPDGIDATIGNSGDDSAIGLGGQVFEGCSSLKKVELGSGMSAIPAGFLASTTSLRTITVPENVINIMDRAFAGSGIYSIDLSKNSKITTISTSVFDGCIYLMSVKLPENITKIEDAAFNSCINLYDFSFVTGLNKLVSIGNSAFAHCGFYEITIPATVESIGTYAFSGCESLNSVIIKDFDIVSGNLTKDIGDYSFSDCSTLKKVELPVKNENNVQVTVEIGSYAFSSCKQLEDINFPANLTEIGDYAFSGCGYSETDWNADDDEFIGTEKAKVYYIMPQNIHTKKQGNDEEVVLYTNFDARYYQPAKAYIDFSVCSTKKSDIGDDAIEICVQLSYDDPDYINGQKLHYQYSEGLENVDLSACSKLKLGTYAFYGCVNLKTVYLPDELREIPKYAFANCYTPVKNGRGKNVSSLGDVALYDEWYYGLTTVKFGSKLETIGEGAFSRDYRLVINGTLPSSLKTIGNRAFECCESLTKIVLPSSLEYIGSSAFLETSRILSKYMSDSKMLEINASNANNLKYIGADAFNKSAIGEFRMNSDAPVTRIFDNTFNGCQYLDNVEFGKNVASIGVGALGACLRLKAVKVYDGCTFHKESIKGEINEEKFPTDKKTTHGYSKGGTWYSATPVFNLVISPLNEYVTVRQNGSTNLPLYSIASDSTGYYSQVKIGDNTYNYSEGELAGENNPEKIYLLPKQTKVRNTVTANEYIKEFSTTPYAINLYGYKEGKDIPVNITERLELEIASNVVNTYSPTITYTVDVTAVPCTGINTNDKEYVSVASERGTTITPEFLSESGDEVTDKIEWKVLSGGEYIRLTPAEDGKTATVVPVGGGGANAEIQIKAGQIIKSVFINVVAPAYRIGLTPSEKLDMIYGKNAEITATVSYNSTYEELSKSYPDAVTFKSSDENIVKVIKTVDEDGKTICTLSPRGAGKAKITATAVAGNRTASVDVYVSSNSLQLTLSDGDGNKVAAGSIAKMRGNNGTTYTYGFNETLGNEEIIVTSSNEEVVTASVSARTKQITFKASKIGTSEITVYPAVGTVKNGVTFTVDVNGDVKRIILSNKSIPMGSSDSVFSSMRNVFNQEITEANAVNYASITDNEIKFTSSNPEYATVDKYGKVTAKKYSDSVKSVIITCTACDGNGEIVKSESTTVKIEKPTITGINITGSSSVYVGNSITCRLSVIPAEGEYTGIVVSYIKGNDKIASYELSNDLKTIKVTGKTAGSVVLKVEVKRYSAVLATKNINFSVKKAVVKTPSKVKWKKCRSAKKKVSLTWKKALNAQGYQIQISTKKNSGYKTVKTVSSGKKVKCTIRKLKKKTYYFRIRAFSKGADGSKKYGKWSAKKKIKVK